jgi:hypothetical protein
MKWKMPHQFFDCSTTFFQFIAWLPTALSCRQMNANRLLRAHLWLASDWWQSAHCRQPSRIAG